MPTNWDEIAKKAGEQTDDDFKSQISSLTRLNDIEILSIINDSGISKVDLVKVLKEVKNSTKSNLDKANVIKNISNGVNSVIEIASKFI